MSHDILEPSAEGQPPDPHEMFLNTAHGCFSEYEATGEVEILWLKTADILPVLGGTMLGGDHHGMTGVFCDMSKNSGGHNPDIAYRFDLFAEDGAVKYTAHVNQRAGFGGWDGHLSFMREEDFVILNTLLEDLHFQKTQTARAIELLQQPSHQPLEVLHWEPFQPNTGVWGPRLRSAWERIQNGTLTAVDWLGKYSIYGYIRGYDPEI